MDVGRPGLDVRLRRRGGVRPVHLPAAGPVRRLRRHLPQGRHPGHAPQQHDLPGHWRSHRLLRGHHRRRHAPHSAPAGHQQGTPLPGAHGAVHDLHRGQLRRPPHAPGRPAPVPGLPARGSLHLDLQPPARVPLRQRHAAGELLRPGLLLLLPGARQGRARRRHRDRAPGPQGLAQLRLLRRHHRRRRLRPLYRRSRHRGGARRPERLDPRARVHHARLRGRLLLPGQPRGPLQGQPVHLGAHRRGRHPVHRHLPHHDPGPALPRRGGRLAAAQRGHLLHLHRRALLRPGQRPHLRDLLRDGRQGLPPRRRRRCRDSRAVPRVHLAGRRPVRRHHLHRQRPELHGQVRRRVRRR